jgi:hypothetical protein
MLSEYRDEIDCPRCGSKATRQYTFSNRHDGEFSDPVVVHRDAQGNYRIPGANDAKAPAGFERVELRSMREVRKVQGEIGQQEYRKYEDIHSRRRAAASENERERRANLAPQIKSNLGREFFRIAVEAANARGARHEQFDPQSAYFDIAENDSSSRGAYSDRRTDWKDVRR